MATTQPVHPLSTGGDTSWVTLKGNGTFDIVQPVETWMDTSGAATFKILYQVLGISNCTMSLETAMKPEGPWVSFSNMTVTCNRSGMVSSYDSDEQHGRWVRWKISGAGDWKVSFRMEGTPADNKLIPEAGSGVVAEGQTSRSSTPTSQPSRTSVSSSELLRSLLSRTNTTNPSR